jgi:hypothetical protein
LARNPKKVAHKPRPKKGQAPRGEGPNSSAKKLAREAALAEFTETARANQRVLSELLPLLLSHLKEGKKKKKNKKDKK